MSANRPRGLNDISPVPISFLLKRIMARGAKYLFVIIVIASLIFFSKGIILVKEGEIAVLIKKTGKDLNNYDEQRQEYNYLLSCPIIAPNSSYKGIQQEVLVEGWHFYNPYSWEHEIHKQVKIEKGMVGIKIRRHGSPLNYKEYQVIAEPGQIGIVGEVLTPGDYPINPYVYKIIFQEAYQIKRGQRGVVTDLAGKIVRRQLFFYGDIKDSRTLLQKLQSAKTPLARYLLANFTPGGQELVKEYNPTALYSTSKLQKALTRELNRIIEGYVFRLPLSVEKILAAKKPGELMQPFAAKGHSLLPPLELRVDNNSSQKQWRLDSKESKKTYILKREKQAIAVFLLDRPLYQAELFAGIELAPDVEKLRKKKPQGKKLLALNRWLLTDAFPYELEKSSFLVAEGERGVNVETLQPGTYYFNRYAKHVEAVDIQSNRFDLTENNKVHFPSFDGFLITMEGYVEWCIDLDRVAEVYVKYKDNRDIIPCVVEKIIMPNARAFIRIEGSKYFARDFISGDTREKFQDSFLKGVSRTCFREGIIIKSARITKCTPPDAICMPIKNREIAIRDRDKYEREKEREQEQIGLQRKTAEKSQKVQIIQAQTTVDVARTDANREKEVALIGMARKLEVARKKLEAARNEAKAITLSAQAKADVIRMQNKAEATAIADARNAFGDGKNYASFLMLQKIAHSLQYILANTDSPFLEVFRKMSKQFRIDQKKTSSQKGE